MKKAIIVIIAVVVALAIGLAILMGVGIAGGLSGLNFSFSKRAELVNTETFPAKSFDELEIEYRSDTVTLVPHSGSEIILEEYMSKDDPNQYAHVQEGGDTLRIEQGERPVGFFLFGINITYAKVYIPESWLGDLDVSCSSGGIECDQALSVNTLQAQTSSGSLHFAQVTTQGETQMCASSGSVNAEEIICDGPLTLTSKSGGIRIGDVTAQEVEMSATSGSTRIGDVRTEQVSATANSGTLEFDSIEGAFDLECSSGSLRVNGGRGQGRAACSSGGVNITLSELTGDLEASARSGSVRLNLPTGTGMEFEGKTSSGSINTPFEDELSYNKDGDEARGQVGSAPYHKVSCETSSGSVHLEWD